VDRFAGAENNLCIRSPYNLRARGVNDYLAPNVSPGRKVGKLQHGRVEWFQRDDVDDLERHCRERSVPCCSRRTAS